jgi:hypothetical protein
MSITATCRQQTILQLDTLIYYLVALVAVLESKRVRNKFIKILNIGELMATPATRQHGEG